MLIYIRLGNGNSLVGTIWHLLKNAHNRLLLPLPLKILSYYLIIYSLFIYSLTILLQNYF